MVSLCYTGLLSVSDRLQPLWWTDMDQSWAVSVRLPQILEMKRPVAVWLPQNWGKRPDRTGLLNTNRNSVIVVFSCLYPCSLHWTSSVHDTGVANTESRTKLFKQESSSFFRAEANSSWRSQESHSVGYSCHHKIFDGTWRAEPPWPSSTSKR